MKSIMKITVCMLLIASFVSCMILPASAAVNNYGTGTKVITVTTKANWGIPGSESITLSQSKGTFRYSETNWYGKETGRTKTKNVYPEWRISVRATDGSHSYTRKWNDSSEKLTLKPNKTYKITVSYYSYQDIFNGVKYRNMQWTRQPYWSVKSTWKVNSCY